MKGRGNCAQAVFPFLLTALLGPVPAGAGWGAGRSSTCTPLSRKLSAHGPPGFRQVGRSGGSTGPMDEDTPFCGTALGKAGSTCIRLGLGNPLSKA